MLFVVEFLWVICVASHVKHFEILMWDVLGQQSVPEEKKYLDFGTNTMSCMNDGHNLVFTSA